MFNLCNLHIVNNDPPKVFPIASAIAQAPTNESNLDPRPSSCSVLQSLTLGRLFATRPLPAQIASPDRLLVVVHIWWW
jgi:hypothetical protein